MDAELPGESPLLMQIYADVLNEPIRLAESKQSVALGAAILGCLAAGEAVTGHAGIGQAIHAMARQREDLMYVPNPDARAAYDSLYGMYRSLAEPAGALTRAMRELRELGAEVLVREEDHAARRVKLFSNRTAANTSGALRLNSFATNAAFPPLARY